MLMSAAVVDRRVAPPASRRELVIDFLYLDLETCTRCRGTDANLEEAYLAYADLRGARLVGAIVSDADLYLARFEGTDLSGLKDLTQHQIDEACGDSATVLPAGLVAPASWPCPPPPAREAEDD